MLTHCSHATNGACYEEIAMASFGKRAQGFTSVCMILCNGGFVISYIVLFKSFMPFSLQTATGQHLPKWCDDSRGGQAFWAVLFSIFFVFPVSTPRDLSTLRFTSAFSVMMSFYIVLVIVFECLLNHGTSPSISEGF